MIISASFSRLIVNPTVDLFDVGKNDLRSIQRVCGPKFPSIASWGIEAKFSLRPIQIEELGLVYSPFVYLCVCLLEFIFIAIISCRSSCLSVHLFVFNRDAFFSNAFLLGAFVFIGVCIKTCVFTCFSVQITCIYLNIAQFVETMINFQWRWRASFFLIYSSSSSFRINLSWLSWSSPIAIFCFCSLWSARNSASCLF